MSGKASWSTEKKETVPPLTTPNRIATWDGERRLVGIFLFFLSTFSDREKNKIDNFILLQPSKKKFEGNYWYP